MSTREQHSEYVKHLTETVDLEGKSLSASALGRLKHLMAMSKGNVRMFLRLVEADRKNYKRSIVRKSKQSFRTAEAIGKEFGEKK